MRRDGRPLGAALLLAAVLASSGAPPAKATDDPNSLTGTCFGALTVLSADPAVVRKIGLIPDRWKLALDDHGKATLYLETPGECKMTIDGAQHTFAYTALSALLDGAALPAPEKKRDTSNAAGLPLNRWLISWSAGDVAFVRWLRKDTGLGRLVTYVPGLRYEEGSGLPHEMRFSAPSPTPSPFVLTATIVADGVMPIAPLVSDLWRETSAGSVMIEVGHIDPDRFGFFKDWKLTTDPASPLGQMIGGGSASGTCTPDRLISPLPARLAGEIDSGCFTAERFLLAKWRKDIPSGGGTAACVTRRVFRIHLPRAWRSATVRLDGRALRVVRHRRRLSAVVDLRDRPAGVARLRAVGRTVSGRRVGQTRTYRLCAKRRHRASRLPASPPPSRSEIWTQCARYAMRGVNTDACARDVEAAIAASAKYRDVNRAIADGYVKLTDCESSPLGGMGEHWGRLDRMVDPTLDVRAPEMLLYLNAGHGRELLGLEYVQTATFAGLPAWGSAQPSGQASPRPSLFGGKTSDGPMAGHSAIQPWHYDLHVYAWVKSPAGLFEPWNPAVEC